MRRIRREDGQTLVVTVFFVVALLGMTAGVLDVGSWFRARRAAQATADAAALAAAQALPADPAQATSFALSYADKNGGGLAAADVKIGSTQDPNDTVTTTVRRTSPGFFSRIFHIDTVDVSATAAALAYQPNEAQWVAPIVVSIHHPLLCGNQPPPYKNCMQSADFDTPTTLPLGSTGAPGAFDMLNLDQNPNGTTGTSELSSWISKGYDQWLPLGGYFSDPGVKFNSKQIDDALAGRYGTELLFPVYDTIVLQGSNATYHIIAWVGFHLDSSTASGTGGSITGYFTRVVWKGLKSSSAPSSSPDLGVRSIELVK